MKHNRPKEASKLLMNAFDKRTDPYDKGEDIFAKTEPDFGRRDEQMYKNNEIYGKREEESHERAPFKSYMLPQWNNFTHSTKS